MKSLCIFLPQFWDVFYRCPFFRMKSNFICATYTFFYMELYRKIDGKVTFTCRENVPVHSRYLTEVELQ